jgi:hypothetical protein
MRFELQSGGGQIQSHPGFGQRLKFIEFEQVVAASRVTSYDPLCLL